MYIFFQELFADVSWATCWCYNIWRDVHGVVIGNLPHHVGSASFCILISEPKLPLQPGDCLLGCAAGVGID